MTGQYVKILARMSGNYAAFHEASISAIYDFTNKEPIDDELLYGRDELYDDETGEVREDKIEEVYKIARDKMKERDDYSDYDEVDAVLINGSYYMSI